jgi:DNA polymerase-3 subunit alpha
MKNLIKKLKIREFDDIVAAEALVRPGPDTETYIKRKNEHLTIKYPSIEIEKILSPTYGVITYQEQIMQIANVMAGFTLQEADILRWAMSKKKKTILASQEEKFISGAIKKGYSYEISKKFYNDILADEE